MKIFVTAFLLLVAGACLFGQEKTPVIFGKVTVQDFTLQQNPLVNNNTNAVIIADKGSTIFVGNNKGWLSPVFKRQVRIKILNKNAFNLAMVKFNLYHRGEYEEKLTELSAVTYNLENGKVTESRLKKEDVFSDKLSRNTEERKFTLPAVKEGCIIEYTYSVSSDFYSYLNDWSFQHVNYPCLWSEYEVDIPKLMQYSIISQLFHSFYIDEAGTGFANYTVREKSEYTTAESDHLSVRINTIKHRWVMKDVPAFGHENYIYSPDNYIDRLSFQLNKIDYGAEAASNGVDAVNIKHTWAKASEELMNADYFGAPVKESNDWLKEPLDKITQKSTNQWEEIQSIYTFVRDNFTCTGRGQYLAHGLKEIFNKKSGSVAEINLLLTAMLHKRSIDASPVVLSTREFGVNSPRYPIMERLDYVICKASFDNRTVYVDASDPFIGFGKLPLNCYNGHARIISDKDSGSVFLLPESVKELNSTTVFIENDENGTGMSGNYQSIPGYHNSYNMRREINKAGMSAWVKKMQDVAGAEFILEHAAVDSLMKLEEPLKIHYDFKFKPVGDAEAAIIYFTPIPRGEGYKENPFSAAERKYPVEFDAPVDELYVLNMEIPKGYVVDELPKSAKVAFNGTDGFYEYIIQKDESNIQLRSRLTLNRAIYRADEYNVLRDFFAFVVKKQAEQVVFKKK